MQDEQSDAYDDDEELENSGVVLTEQSSTPSGVGVGLIPFYG